MADREGLAVRAVVLGALGALVYGELDTVKGKLADALGPGDRLAARLPDGTPLGYVYVTAPKRKLSARVVDMDALTAHIADHHPGHMMLVPRPEFVTQLLADAEAGEVIPGVDVTTVQGTPAMTVKPDHSAVRQHVDALRANAALVIDP